MIGDQPQGGANVVQVSNTLDVAESREPGVLIRKREYERLVERVGGCRPSGWGDLWLAVAGIGGGLAAAALVTVIALPASVPGGDEDILWMLVLLGCIVLALCLAAYCGQRHHHGQEISDLKKDLEMYMGLQRQL